MGLETTAVAHERLHVDKMEQDKGERQSKENIPCLHMCEEAAVHDADDVSLLVYFAGHIMARPVSVETHAS